MTKKLTALLLALCMILALLPTQASASSEVPTEAEAYERILALKAQYPDGMSWTNDQSYKWQGDNVVGLGCAGFAFLLSDAAFGDLPARYISPVSLQDVRVGDILRIDGGTHSVVVLEVRTDSVVIAEGNFNKQIRWGRVIPKSKVEQATYLATRYPFADASAHWASGAINYCVYHRNLMNGVSARSFDPEGAMTRGMLVTVLWRLMREPEGGENPFTDVEPGRYYTEAIAWAAAQGIVNGVGNNKFDPNGNITREQLATILYRCCNEPELRQDDIDDFSTFPDVDAVGNSAKDAMRWAVAEHIINGSGGKLLPKNNATRAEVATIMMRFIENVLYL